MSQDSGPSGRLRMDDAFEEIKREQRHKGVR